MKKQLILSVLVLSLSLESVAQCELPTQLPYVENTETALISDVPECMTTSYNSFASTEVFKTISGPVPGFDGQLLAYDTALGTGVEPWSNVEAKLYLPPMEFAQGISYTISYKYGSSNTDNGVFIDDLSVYVTSATGSFVIAAQQNITGTTPTNFTSQPFTVPANGIYNIMFVAGSMGSQGVLYLDDFNVQEVSTAGISINSKDLLSLYPNPVKDVLTLSHHSTIDSVELYNSIGQVVFAESPKMALANLNLERLAAGVYYASIRSGSQIINTRIIKE